MRGWPRQNSKQKLNECLKAKGKDKKQLLEREEIAGKKSSLCRFETQQAFISQSICSMTGFPRRNVVYLHERKFPFFVD